MYVTKVVILFVSSFLLSLNSGACLTKNDVLQSKIRKVFEIWKGDKEIGPGIRLPSLKHIKIVPFEGNYEKSSVHLTYSLGGIDLIGLNNFTIENITVADADNTLDGSVVLAIPEVNLYADNYLVNGKAYLLVPLTGKGSLSITLIDVKLIFYIKLVKSSTSAGLNADAFTFDFKIGRIKSDFSEISWGLSQTLSDGGMSLIEDNHQEIVKMVQKAVVDFVNSNLRTLNKSDILQFVDKAIK